MDTLYWIILRENAESLVIKDLLYSILGSKIDIRISSNQINWHDLIIAPDREIVFIVELSTLNTQNLICNRLKYTRIKFVTVLIESENPLMKLFYGDTVNRGQHNIIKTIKTPVLKKDLHFLSPSKTQILTTQNK